MVLLFKGPFGVSGEVVFIVGDEDFFPGFYVSQGF